MIQYIDKAAVVEEIKKKLDKHSKLHSFNYGAVKDLESLWYFLDTLEVKEIDSFIEKACRGIEHLLSGYIIRNFHFGDSYEMDTLIEDFKNYMKGE